MAIEIKNQPEEPFSVTTSRGETQIVQRAPLLDSKGELISPGFAFNLLPSYRRADIKAASYRIKEWDYYLINDGTYAVALTMSDMSYAAMLSVSLLDLRARTFTTLSDMVFMTFGKVGMPEDSSEGSVEFETKKVKMSFEATPKRRHLHALYKGFKDGEDFECDFVLDCIPRDSMVIATPWAEDKKAFYYNQKIVAMRAAGWFSCGSELYSFDPKDSFGLLDWGRGVWTRDNTWYWGVAQGWQDGCGSNIPPESAAHIAHHHESGVDGGFGTGNVKDVDGGLGTGSGQGDEIDFGTGNVQGDDGGFGAGNVQGDEVDLKLESGLMHRVGLNIGYGFGDTSAASENMLFVDGRATKLGKLDFGVPKKKGGENAKTIGERFDIMSPWHIQDEEGRIDLLFTPEIDRCDNMDFKVIVSDQHQAFGSFSGTILLDDGSTFVLTDLRGAAEVVRNKY